MSTKSKFTLFYSFDKVARGMDVTTSNAEWDFCGWLSCRVGLENITASTAAASHGKYLPQNLKSKWKLTTAHRYETSYNAPSASHGRIEKGRVIHAPVASECYKQMCLGVLFIAETDGIHERRRWWITRTSIPPFELTSVISRLIHHCPGSSSNAQAQILTIECHSSKLTGPYVGALGRYKILPRIHWLRKVRHRH